MEQFTKSCRLYDTHVQQNACPMCYCKVLQLTHSEVYSCDQANLAASSDVIYKTVHRSGVWVCPEGESILHVNAIHIT